MRFLRDTLYYPHFEQRPTVIPEHKIVYCLDCGAPFIRGFIHLCRIGEIKDG